MPSFLVFNARMIIKKGDIIPKKIKAFDEGRRERMKAIKVVLPAALQRARKYRSSGNWQKVREIKLKIDPLCFDPFGYHKKEGGDVGAAQVHHIKGLATHYHMRAFRANLASICTRCHAVVEKMERQNKQTSYLFKI